MMEQKAPIQYDVIRIFKKIYSTSENPTLESIINDEILIYAHCVVKFGVKMSLWGKVGNLSEIGEIENIIFRGTEDYGGKEVSELVKNSDNWHVWRINDMSFEEVGKLEGKNRVSYLGLVINPVGILELLKGKKYPPLYPDFE